MMIFGRFLAATFLFQLTSGGRPGPQFLLGNLIAFPVIP